MEFQAHRPLPSAPRALRAPAGAAARVGAPGPGGSCSQPPPSPAPARSQRLDFNHAENKPKRDPLPRAAASAAQGQALPCSLLLFPSLFRAQALAAPLLQTKGSWPPRTKAPPSPRASTLGALSGQHKEAVHRTALVTVLKMHRIPPRWWWLRAWQHLCPRVPPALPSFGAVVAS